MEHSHSQFIDRQQREQIDFYQTWIRDVFRDDIAGVDELIALRNRFALNEHELGVVRDTGLDVDMFGDLLEDIDSKIQGRVAETAEELLGNVFLANLFRVGIQVGEEVRVVEGLKICGTRIMPLIDGEPYDGPIDEVIFDR